jgi:AcrR family transcriptional regulator
VTSTTDHDATTRATSRGGPDEGRDAAAARPLGREAVRHALVDAAIELIVERGLSVSVRDIAAHAGVNHGLVHTYFGSKDGLLAAAYDEINARAAAERDADGFPPRDLAGRRGGEIAKALARVMLDSDHDLFSSHPVTTAWRRAIAAKHPDMPEAEITERVMVATTLGLGYALFADHMGHVMGMDDEARRAADARVLSLVADIGLIPPD